MAQDTIGVLKYLFPKKALVNGKSSEYNKKCWKTFKDKLFLPSP